MRKLVALVAALGFKLGANLTLRPCGPPRFLCFSLSNKGAFVVMKEPSTYLTNHLARIHWHPQGSRAPNGQGPEGFKGFHRQDFRDNGSTYQHLGNIPAGFFAASLPPFTQCDKSLF